MITGLHLAEHVHLSKVAGRIAGTAQPESKTRHLRRFLGNEDREPGNVADLTVENGCAPLSNPLNGSSEAIGSDGPCSYDSADDSPR